MGNVEASLFVHDIWPAVRKAIGQLSNEHIADKAGDTPTLLCLGKQAAQ
ncbi:hypothetical protein LILAB_09280 [Corallococcus macrosporus]|uniref:Uncharacterized protein n=1 Tax=Myxococcus fulvus (strain ATCC BAA-855 / HW-1) TaxID=483219 RepID=F8CIA8_MYXFH|nr:hypothetical protein LILAB_09280 [Corallococcus macrosporus]